MIEVEHLTKTYVGRPAVDDISFRVGQGEIVGLLGPNGAGKSTTMRILSGFMPATLGSVRIAGFDIFSQSIQARRKIGYMPENVPLYTEMRVREYLRFRGALHGLSGRDLRQRIGMAMERCGLTDVRRKIIGTLSKGYRQRVGLADALVHDPALLILDEPTNGLDPNQIRQVRSLIRELKQEHTILISTHILSEVEQLCDRVIILHQGRIQAEGTPAALAAELRTAGLIRIQVKGEEGIADRLLKLSGVRKVSQTARDDGWLTLEVRTESGTDMRDQVYQMAVERRWTLRELARQTATLEDVFAELTHADAA